MLASFFYSIKEISPLGMHEDETTEVLLIGFRGRNRQDEVGTSELTRPQLPWRKTLCTLSMHCVVHSSSSSLIVFKFLSNRSQVSPPERISISNTKNASFVNTKKIPNAGKCSRCMVGGERDILQCNVAICTVRMHHFFLFNWLLLSTNTIWHHFQIPSDSVLISSSNYYCHTRDSWGILGSFLSL